MSPDEAVRLAAEIPGWMSEDELRWLALAASERERIVEVGCWQGRSTKVLALMCPGVVYAIDDLTGVPNDQVERPEVDAAFRYFLSSEIRSGKVEVIRRRSLSAARSFKGKADLIFIDGDHEYPAPLKDIKAWRKRLAPDGLLCGHDARHRGVKQSLQELGIGGFAVESIWIA